MDHSDHGGTNELKKLFVGRLHAPEIPEFRYSNGCCSLS